MSNHIQKQQEQLDHHQQAMTVLKLVGQQQVLDQYTFGEEQPSDILQHASVPPQLQPYRLQPTQPNLQESSLQERSYGTDETLNLTMMFTPNSCGLE